jgi:hypothetical protein
VFLGGTLVGVVTAWKMHQVLLGVAKSTWPKIIYPPPKGGVKLGEISGM